MPTAKRRRLRLNDRIVRGLRTIHNLATADLQGAEDGDFGDGELADADAALEYINALVQAHSETKP